VVRAVGGSSPRRPEEEIGQALAAGFIQEGVERDKFLVAGERVDVLTYGRLVTDPSPATVLLPILV